jgi:hypothetical protein
MNEADQLFGLLSSDTFWVEDEYPEWSMNMGGGISVKLCQCGSIWTWKLTGSEGSVQSSPRAFLSVREAKGDLRAELERRRKQLVYESMEAAID